MMSLQQTLKNLYEPFANLPCPVTHYERRGTYPYVIWAEEEETSSFYADDGKKSQQIAGTVDYFTREEFDQTVDDIQDILESERITWTLEAVQFEDSTNLIHYTWRWRTF